MVQELHAESKRPNDSSVKNKNKIICTPPEPKAGLDCARTAQYRDPLDLQRSCAIIKCARERINLGKLKAYFLSLLIPQYCISSCIPARYMYSGTVSYRTLLNLLFILSVRIRNSC